MLNIMIFKTFMKLNFITDLLYLIKYKINFFKK